LFPAPGAPLHGARLSHPLRATNGFHQRACGENIRYDALDKICGISLITTTAWHPFMGGPVNLTQNVILTRSDLIKFAK
jgi:hypothetical protein